MACPWHLRRAAAACRGCECHRDGVSGRPRVWAGGLRVKWGFPSHMGEISESSGWNRECLSQVSGSRYPSEVGGISESSSLTKHAGQLSSLHLRFSVLLLLKGLDLLAVSEHQAIICSLTCTRHKAPPRRLRGDAAETHMRIVQDDVKIRVRPEATRRPFRPEARGARPGSAPRRASANPP